MIVMKFGGTSVANGERIRQCADLVKLFSDRQPVVVSSALAGVTDTLLATAEMALTGDRDGVESSLQRLLKKHLAVVEEVAPGTTDAKKLTVTLEGQIQDLREICHGILLLNELSPRSNDLISSFGERMAVPLIAAAIRQLGISSRPVDAREYVKTDDSYGAAVVDLAKTQEKFAQKLLPLIREGVVPVLTGFIATNDNNVTTTIGRNGSDYTATIVGYALECEEVWIWKDVDGVLTADPRIYPGAMVVSELSYQEAAELSHFGGQVVHPKTMQPAILKSIPIRIKNTSKPDKPGTLISSRADTKRTTLIVTSIDNLSLITVEGAGLQMTPMTIVQILEAVASIGINILMISMASSDYNISFLVRSPDAEKALLSLEEKLEIMRLIEKSISRIIVEDHVAIIACVGANLKGRVGIAGKIFGTLGKSGVNLIAIAQGSSEFNISMVIDQDHVKKAVTGLHENLGELFST